MDNYARLAALLGPARLRTSCSPRAIEPDEALAIGLATEVVDDAEARVADLCETLASHAPVTMRVTKEALRRLRVAALPAGTTSSARPRRRRLPRHRRRLPQPAKVKGEPLSGGRG